MKDKRYIGFSPEITILSAIVMIIIMMIGTPSVSFATDPPAKIGGVINSYARILTLNSIEKRITIDNISGNSSDFNIGRKVLIIQMKGANIHTTNNGNYGIVSNLNNAGNYELTTVVNRSGNTIWLETVERNYTASGSVQLVSVPQYTSAEVVSTITALSWDPAQGRGGIVALEVQHELTLSANIRADLSGFRGGAVNGTGSSNDANNNTYRANQASGYGRKGEGIAAYISNQEFGRGPLANGGGGGNTHNAGGGGGANFASGGGGGTGWPQNNVEGGDGLGGHGFVYEHNVNKIFMGGGGGSGQQNDGTASAGANGGGIVLIRAGKLNATRAATISANGGHANNTTGNDGAGGAGAGGTIFLDVLNFANDMEIQVEARGGNGGNVASGDKHGGGGGGGSGAVLFHLPPNDKIIIDNQPGIPGNDRTNGSTTATAGSPPCALAPCDPITGWVPAGNLTPLPVALLFFKGEAKGNANLLTWATASEIDNDYFIIEKSRDGKAFTPLVRIQGNGTTSSPLNYEYKDVDVYGRSYYYRLVQTDFNGKRTLHPIVYISRSLPGEDAIEVGPNPFNNTIHIHLSTHDDQLVAVHIFDQYGKIVSKGHFKALEGHTTYEYQVEESLPSGIYYLKVNGDAGLQDAVKIIKQ